MFSGLTMCNAVKTALRFQNKIVRWAKDNNCTNNNFAQQLFILKGHTHLYKT